ncbi:MAG: hypothetical protein WCI75_19340, partial [candidate division NC10 bacterium]
MSAELLKLAALEFKFVPFTKKITAFGRKMGETVTMPYYKPLTEPTSAELEEKTRIPIDQLTMGKYTITIKEWGRGVEYSSLAEDLSALSPNEGAQKALKDQMSLSMDAAAAAAFMGTNAKIAFQPTSLTNGTFDTDGTPSVAALVNLTKDHLGVVRDLADQLAAAGHDIVERIFHPLHYCRYAAGILQVFHEMLSARQYIRNMRRRS